MSERYGNHELIMTKWPYVGDADFIYAAYCSCGRYASGKWTSPGHAEQAWRDHAKAKAASDLGK